METTSPDKALRSRLLKRHLPRAMQYVGNRASSLLLFGREILDNPRAMGAICPSSPTLARRMAQHVPCGPGRVVELGGGTGTVTAALLKRGIDPRQLSVVERSAKLSALLRRRFPEVSVVHGDAVRLAELLGADSGQVSAIVSGLPLRSLEPDTVRDIMAQLERVLRPGGIFIQFTYSHRDLRARLSPHFRTIHSCMVWGNVPPARIDVYRFHS
jgi:phospholipid N-methyltransferase